MKVVTTPAVREEAKYYCDSCGVECFLEVIMSAWYGSKNDLTKGTVHLCDECWDKVKTMFHDQFGINVKLEDAMF